MAGQLLLVRASSIPFELDEERQTILQSIAAQIKVFLGQSLMQPLTNPEWHEDALSLRERQSILLAALRELNEAQWEDRSRADLLSLVLDRSVEIIGVDFGAFLLPDPSDPDTLRLALTSRKNMAPDTIARLLPNNGQIPLHSAWAEGKVLENFGAAVGNVRTPLAMLAGPTLFLPIRKRNGDTAALLLLVRLHGRPPFSTDDLTLLDQIASHSAVLLEAEERRQTLVRESVARLDAEASSRRAVDVLATVTSALPDLYARFDANARLIEIHVPEEMKSLFAPVSEWRDGLLGELISEEQRAQVRHLVRQALARHSTIVREYALELPEQQRHFELRLQPFGINEAILLARDITDAKLMAHTLQQSEERLRRLTALNRDGLIISDGREILDMNAAAATFLGVPAQHLVGKPLSALPLRDTQGHRLAPLTGTRTPATSVSLQSVPEQERLLEIESRLVSYEERPLWATTLRDVTQHIRDQAAIRASEARFARIFEHNPVGITIISFDGQRVIDVNRAITELLGLSREELVGSVPSPEKLGLDESTVIQLAAAVATGDPLPTIETTMVGAEGLIFVAISGELIVMDGEPCLLFNIYDITERRRAEIALRRHATAFENIQDAVIIVEADQKITDCNPAAQRLFGLEREELIGQRLTERLPEPFPRSLLEQAQVALARTGRWSGEYIYASPGGSRTLDVVIQTLPTSDGKQQDAAIIICHDVTRHKDIQNELKDQKRLLENLVEIARATAEGRTLTRTLDNTLGVALSLTGADRATMFLFNEQGDIASAHHAARASQTKEWRFHHQRQRLTTLEKFGLATWCIQNHKSALVPDVHADSRWTRPDETPAASALAVPLMYSGMALGVLTLVSDTANYFTEDDLALMEAAASQIALSLESALLLDAKSRLVDELSAAKEAAEEANRAKSTFLSGMSHELRTPLSVIIGYTELMLEMSKDDGQEDTSQTLDRVLNASRHLLAIINDVLDLSKIEAGRMSVYPNPVALQSLVRSVTASVQPLVEQNHNQLLVDTRNAPPEIMADATRLRQILINLLSNAAKFTEEGVITLTISVSADSMRFEVRDTGIGISAADLSRLFIPFTQLDDSPTRRFGGTGLGLAICRRLATLMGGEITVESTSGHGSTFTLRLPLTPPAASEL